jgi:hypothetical protein
MLSFDDRCNDLATFNECSSKITSGIDLKFNSISSKVDKSFADEDN